ncbi:MAG: hypothetical protein JW874_11800 [Spirochaetales bacterium]|nr:hypothetical protein [Spirochaetales bacterium]
MKRSRKKLVLINLFAAVCFISCFTLDEKNKTRFVDPSKTSLSSFDFSLGTKGICPGQEYIPFLILYTKSGKNLNGTVRYEDLEISSKNGSFIITSRNIRACEQILDIMNFEYSLTIRLKGNKLPAVTRKFGINICNEEPVHVKGKNVYLEASLYRLANMSQTEHHAILLYDREADSYYLRPDTMLRVYASEETEKIYFIYPYSSNLFSKLKIFIGSQNSEWTGQIIRSPLKDSSVLFTEIKAAGFSRNSIIE